MTLYSTNILMRRTSNYNPILIRIITTSNFSSTIVMSWYIKLYLYGTWMTTVIDD